MRRRWIEASLSLTVVWQAAASEPARPLYYQDPDGKPAYAASPRKTRDGRDFRAVFATDGAAAPEAAKGDRRILYYRNPMGLPDTSPVPRKDPMGMDYQPVYAEDGTTGDASGTVRISPGRMQTLGVRTEAAVRRPAETRIVRATGVLQFDERRLATVTTRVGGWIEHLAVAATGDTVRPGQVMATLYAPDIVAAEKEYLVGASLGAGLPGASLERLRALDVPQSEIARLRRSARVAHSVAVVAVANGVVVDKPVQQGMRVEAGEALYRTADLSDLWLIAEVQERDLGSIHPGQLARATFVAFPGRNFTGRVDFIYPSLSAETRTARVRIVLANPDGALRAAMFANVAFDAGAAGAAVLTVANSSVLDDGARQVVLVDRGGGRFEPREVHLGARGDERVEILDGLEFGERVVTGANFLIDAESNLRAALHGFTP